MNLSNLVIPDLDQNKQWITDFAGEFSFLSRATLFDPVEVDAPIIPDMKAIRSTFQCEEMEWIIYFSWSADKSKAVTRSVTLTTIRGKGVFRHSITERQDHPFLIARDCALKLKEFKFKKVMREVVKANRIENPNIMDLLHEHITEKGFRVTRPKDKDENRVDTTRLRVHLPRTIMYLHLYPNKRIGFGTGQQVMVLEQDLADPNHGLLWAVDKLLKFFGDDMDQLYKDLYAKKVI